MAKFEVYKDKAGEFRWRLKSGNGTQIASSGEGYTDKAGCMNGIKAVKRDAPDADVVEAEARHPAPGVLAYLWASPLTVVGLAVAFVAWSTGAMVGRRDGVIEVHGGILRTLLPRCGIGVRPEAMTIGHVIVAASTTTLDRHRDHEWVHVRQAGRWGPLFPVAYVAAALMAVLTGQHPYHDNLFERDARGE